MKRIICVLLSLIMLSVTAITVFAEDEPENGDGVYTITIEYFNNFPNPADIIPDPPEPVVMSFKAGETVTLRAELADDTRRFAMWKIEDSEGKEFFDIIEEHGRRYLLNAEISFTMPAKDLTAYMVTFPERGADEPEEPISDYNFYADWDYTRYDYPEWVTEAFEEYEAEYDDLLKILNSDSVSDNFKKEATRSFIEDREVWSTPLYPSDPAAAYDFFVEQGEIPSDIIILILKHEYSDPLKYKYTADSFPEIDAAEFCEMMYKDKSPEEKHEKWLENSNYRTMFLVKLGEGDTAESAIKKLAPRVNADLYWVSFESENYEEDPCIYDEFYANNILGDLNGDGKTNSRDVVDIMKVVAGNKNVSGAEKTCADVNCDGKINSRDVILLMKKVVNGSIVTGDSSLYCRLLGHTLSATYATETVHSVHSDSPHCEKRTYLVVSCGHDGCGYIEKILVNSKRIASCHG